MIKLFYFCFITQQNLFFYSNFKVIIPISALYLQQEHDIIINIEKKGNNLMKFNLFKKAKTSVLACTDGKVVPISEVSDPVFSQKMMGDGFAVIPSSTTVCSPVNGKISMIFDTNHAFGLTMSNGLEVLVHIGIDTVNEKGAGFKRIAAINDTVKAGDPIIEIDLEALKAKGYDMATMVIFTNDKYSELTLSEGEHKAKEEAGTIQLA